MKAATETILGKIKPSFTSPTFGEKTIVYCDILELGEQDESKSTVAWIVSENLRGLPARKFTAVDEFKVKNIGEYMGNPVYEKI